MNLKDDQQQNIQLELDFSSARTGEARPVGREETESSRVMNGTEPSQHESIDGGSM
jgi:hypothetical protein